MQEQPSIFDEVIIEPTPPRRRDLLSVPLKIYVLVGIIAGAWLFLTNAINLVLAFISLSAIASTERYTDIQYMLPVMLLGCLPGLIMFTSTLLVWMEAKLAIRISGVCFALWCVYEMIVILNYGLNGFASILAALLVIPYFVMLFKIRHAWEHKAIKR